MVLGESEGTADTEAQLDGDGTADRLADAEGKGDAENVPVPEATAVALTDPLVERVAPTLREEEGLADRLRVPVLLAEADIKALGVRRGELLGDERGDAEALVDARVDTEALTVPHPLEEAVKLAETVCELDAHVVTDAVSVGEGETLAVELPLAVPEGVPLAHPVGESECSGDRELGAEGDSV